MFIIIVWLFIEIIILINTRYLRYFSGIINQFMISSSGYTNAVL